MTCSAAPSPADSETSPPGSSITTNSDAASSKVPLRSRGAADGEEKGDRSSVAASPPPNPSAGGLPCPPLPSPLRRASESASGAPGPVPSWPLPNTSRRRRATASDSRVRSSSRFECAMRRCSEAVCGLEPVVTAASKRRRLFGPGPAATSSPPPPTATPLSSTAIADTSTPPPL